MQPNYDVDMQLNIKVPAQDGVGLSTDIYLPKAAGRFPAIPGPPPDRSGVDSRHE